MKTLIKKEIRLILPAWIAAMLLAIAPAWIIQPFFPHDNVVDHIPPPLFIMLGMLLLGIASFGQEFNYRTFPLLLSQPVPRSHLWWAKIMALGITFISLVSAAVVSWNLFELAYPAYLFHYSDAYSGLWLWVLIFVGGSLWTTLLLRQATGAFWFTLVAPAAIFFALGLLADFFNLSDKATTGAGHYVFLIYSVAGFFWAQRLFFNAQDTDWTGGNVFFQWRKNDAEQTASSFALPFQGRFLTLIWKEIKLHEISLFLAVVLLVINFAAMAMHGVVTNSNAKMALEFSWALWLLMPLLIGCSAVAEERRLGVAESQLCLPVSRRAQFFIKFFIALMLSVILGAVAPSIIERTRNFGVTDWPDFWIFYMAPAIFFVSFYASTFVRSTLQAIGLALAIPVVTGVTLGALFFWTFHRICEAFDARESEITGPAACMLRVALPVSLFVFTGLMFWNFKWLHETRKVVRRNVVAIFIGFFAAYALANAIYVRPWELLTPVDSPYGPARLTRENPGEVIISNYRVDAVLPDGRLWDEDVNYDWSGWWGQAHPNPMSGTGRFLHGTNWIAASVINGSFMLGIKSDGSLWCVQPWESVKTTHIGSDTDWMSVAGAGNVFLLLKKDRSLWLWGTNLNNYYNKRIKFDVAAELPVCLGNKTNWSGFFSLFPSWNLVENTDGELWTWQEEGIGTNYVSHFVQSTNLDSQWMNYAYQWEWAVGVKTNGELWFSYGRATNQDQAGLPLYTNKFQIASSSKWKTVTFSDSGSLVMLRDDGTLWKWKIVDAPFIRDWRQFKPEPFRPVQLGHYSDWVSLTQGTALAADGSLWDWDEISDRVWLAPSRKPVYLGNIFQGAARQYSAGP